MKIKLNYNEFNLQLNGELTIIINNKCFLRNPKN